MSEHSKGKLKIVETHAHEIILVDEKYEGVCNFTVNQPEDYLPKARENAEHLVKCWNSHDKLLAACKRDEDLAHVAILGTPTSEQRNKLTEINILRLQAISEAESEV